MFSKKPISAWLPSIDRILRIHLPIQISNKIGALAKIMPGAAVKQMVCLTRQKKEGMNMKKTVLGLTMVALAACGRGDLSSSSRQSAQSAKGGIVTNVAFTAVEAGEEYPTDAPVPKDLVNKKVLLISYSKTPSVTKRIVVDKSASLSDPLAGEDYPTEIPVPASLTGKKILVLDSVNRLVINVEMAVAGIDFPTDGPADLKRDFLVWAIGETKRFPLDQIVAFEKSQAGIDYPTDGPADMNRNFYVVLTVENDTIVRNQL